MSTRRGKGAWVIALALLASACDSEGPGSLTASVQGPTPLGAAVVEVRGEGILGFEGAGSTHVFSSSPQPGDYRVLLIGEVPGELEFKVEVQDRKGSPPTASVLSAAGGDNLPLATVQAFQVRIVR